MNTEQIKETINACPSRGIMANELIEIAIAAINKPAIRFVFSLDFENEEDAEKIQLLKEELRLKFPMTHQVMMDNIVNECVMFFDSLEKAKNILSFFKQDHLRDAVFAVLYDSNGGFVGFNT